MIFVTGATGYLGRPLVERLVAAGQSVLCLVRPGSERKVPPGAKCITGDPLLAASYADQVPEGAVWVHLVGTPKPAPWKAAQFRAVDLPSALQAIHAARRRNAARFVYVSVAHPAPIMKAYVAVRRECEDALVRSGLPYTILRPWYVLGPRHWWPYALVPVYWGLRVIPQTRAAATRLGLVTHPQMVGALFRVCLEAKPGNHIVDAPGIAAARLVS